MRMLLTILVVALTCSFALADGASVTVYKAVPGQKAAPKDWPVHLFERVRKDDLTNPTAVNIGVVLKNEKKTISLRYSGRQVTRKDGTKEWIGTFGWPSPNSNWYHDGFVYATVDGVKAQSHPFKLESTGSKDAAMARFSAEMPKGKLIHEFLLFPDDDKLLFNVKFEPAEGKTVKSIKLQFNNYPSDFGKPDKRSRRVTTAKREMTPAKDGGSTNAKLTPQEPWALYFDTFYDIAEKRGKGPSAIAFDTTKTDMAVSCGGYRCTARAALKPGVMDAPFVLWDFSGITNADALAYMKALEIAPRE